MTAKTTRENRPVLVLHKDLDAASDLCHRLNFIQYSAETRDSLDARELGNREFLAIIVDEQSFHEISADSRRGIQQLLQTTPTLVMTSAALRLPLRSAEQAPIWAVELPLKRARLAHLLSQAASSRGKPRLQRLTGNSFSIGKVRQLIEQVAGFDTNVLIGGESGTGKELVARTIHELSPRSDQAFVPINCGAIPADLLESELFGHEKGAFTGAVATRKGRFELAQGGTLFLDEIGDMPMPMQVKLLRVLQERSFQRIGSNTIRRCDVRIVAATHCNLRDAVANGEFREDLYYRLNVFPIDMPPLRKRLDDIPGLLSELVMGRADATRQLRLKPCALQLLASYDWPGNVRELANLVERLAILHPTGVVGAPDLPAKYHVNATNAIPLDDGPAPITTCALPADGLLLKDHLQQVERSLIDSALAQADGVVARAARLLHMRRTTLVEKLKLA